MENEAFDIGRAVEEMREGKGVARAGWNGKGQYVKLQVPDELTANTLPYVYIVTVSGARVPWVASQTDLLSKDWYVVA